jgi:hypothetical protein
VLAGCRPSRTEDQHATRIQGTSKRRLAYNADIRHALEEVKAVFGFWGMAFTLFVPDD